MAEPVVIQTDLTIAEGENIPGSAVLKITGPQPVDPGVTVPLNPATYDLTAQLPPNAFKPLSSFDDITISGNENNVSLICVVTHTNLDTVAPSYGYEYGYEGGTGGGSAKLKCTYKGPILKFPVPPPQAGPIESPTERFTIPGGGGGGGGGGPSDFPNVISKGFLPGVPNADPSGKVRAADVEGTQFIVVFDGFSGQNDVVAFFDQASLGFLGSFQLPLL